ncbi:MAG TPA: hypothetical protein VLF61_01345 [Rhabdochlamydiaceae bacterium]|nr:hypothetical protein [Rhabdochlamydiaceae bacterium]
MLKSDEIMDMLLDAHVRSAELAVDTAIRTGTALVFSKNGKIKKVRPKYKYILVSTEKGKSKRPVTLKQVVKEIARENA